MNSSTVSVIDREILRAIHATGTISFGILLDKATSERFSDIFYSVDRLMQLGVIRMRRSESGYDLCPGADWAAAGEVLGTVVRG